MIESGAIDLRSDTVTLPSNAMREAMLKAPVGDDYYGEDPTVHALEEHAATLLGKEAALLVPSGTMGNLIAHMAHSPLGGIVIGPESAHTFVSEVGGPARIAGVTARTVPQRRGELDLQRYAALIHPGSLLSPPTTLLWVEQPTRGYVVPLDDLIGLRHLAEKYGLPVHFDGARIFNAAAALEVPASEIVRHADTVMFCLSKSLAAPVGSVLVGSATFIASARKFRQLLGGGMRQAGVFAAAGVYALDNNIDRLADDHVNAKRLANGIRQIDGLSVDREAIETNIFFVETSRSELSAADLANRLRRAGVLVNLPASGQDRVRFVTHHGIGERDVDLAIDRVRYAMATADMSDTATSERASARA